jgi:ribosomal protein L37AE/L43A
MPATRYAAPAGRGNAETQGNADRRAFEAGAERYRRAAFPVEARTALTSSKNAGQAVRFFPFHLRKQTAKAVTAMFTRIVCPSCGHVGATAMSLPRLLICSQCGHGAVIKSGTPTRSPILTREGRAAGRAAWERYEAADARAKTPP